MSLDDQQMKRMKQIIRVLRVIRWQQKKKFVVKHITNY